MTACDSGNKGAVQEGDYCSPFPEVAINDYNYTPNSIKEPNNLIDMMFDMNGKPIKKTQAPTGIYFTLDKKRHLIKKHIIIK